MLCMQPAAGAERKLSTDVRVEAGRNPHAEDDPVRPRTAASHAKFEHDEVSARRRVHHVRTLVGGVAGMERERQQADQAARADPWADVEERSGKRPKVIDDAYAPGTLDDVEPARLTRCESDVHRLPQPDRDGPDAKRALTGSGGRHDDRCSADRC